MKMQKPQSKRVQSMKSKKYHVLVDSLADQKFVSHLEFLARVSEAAAMRLYESREKALDFLEENPESCPLYVPEMPTDVELRYKMFGGRYRIVFTINGQMVYAYDTQDCRQDSDKSLV